MSLLPLPKFPVLCCTGVIIAVIGVLGAVLFDWDGEALGRASLFIGIAGALAIVYGRIRSRIDKVQRPSVEAFDEGYEQGYEKGWREGRSVGRPQIVRLPQHRAPHSG